MNESVKDVFNIGAGSLRLFGKWAPIGGPGWRYDDQCDQAYWLAWGSANGKPGAARFIIIWRLMLTAIWQNKLKA